MRFLIDANLPRAAIVVCQKFGHQVKFARDIGMAAASDEISPRVPARLVQHFSLGDLDFWPDVRRYPPDQYRGIVVLRLPDTTVALAGRIERQPLRSIEETHGAENVAKNATLSLRSVN